MPNDFNLGKFARSEARTYRVRSIEIGLGQILVENYQLHDGSYRFNQVDVLRDDSLERRLDQVFGVVRVKSDRLQLLANRLFERSVDAWLFNN
jgi:hypothetical protein